MFCDRCGCPQERLTALPTSRGTCPLGFSGGRFPQDLAPVSARGSLIRGLLPAWEGAGSEHFPRHRIPEVWLSQSPAPNPGVRAHRMLLEKPRPRGPQPEPQPHRLLVGVGLGQVTSPSRPVCASTETASGAVVTASSGNSTRSCVLLGEAVFLFIVLQPTLGCWEGERRSETCKAP